MQIGPAGKGELGQVAAVVLVDQILSDDVADLPGRTAQINLGEVHTSERSRRLLLATTVQLLQGG